MAISVQAQSTGQIKISDLKIEESGDYLNVSFRADAPKKLVKSSYSMVYAPFVTDGNYSVSLPAIVVSGRTAEKARLRSEMATGENQTIDGATYIRNGESTQYRARIQTQRWMQGAALRMDNILYGCCSAIDGNTTLLAENIGIRGDVIEYVQVIPEIEPEVFVPVTLADTLSISFPFVANVSEYDEANPFRIYDDERDNALIVYYGQGSSTINPNYRGNKQILINLTVVVSMIAENSSSDIEKIVIGGFASPEGGSEINRRLARERAEAVMDHIIETTGVPESQFIVVNGEVDWQGLRYMVSKTNILERDEIIRIIDEVPVWDTATQRGRLGELMRLNNGVTYRYLMSEFFPLMRNGAFIKVYYSNK